MLTISLQAVAGHNSLGPHAHVIEPDEVELEEDADGAEVGDLRPDVVDSDYDVKLHENLEDTPAEARSDPVDQSGLRYDGDRCETWGEFEGETDAFSKYEDSLRGGDGCYVGYMDLQFEYEMVLSILVTEAPSDTLYQVNPSNDDEFCQGEEDTGDRGVGDESVPETNVTVNGSLPVIVGEDSAVDEAIASATRRNDDRCSGSGHSWFLPGSIFVDTDLLEAGPTAATEAGGAPAGSGVLSLPFSMTPYLYLFGQPHPDTDDANRSDLAAGEGPFGPNPSETGSPLADLSGACGDRTRDCRILSPQDILNYDDNFPRDVETSARVCLFFPQYSFSVPLSETRRGASACGNTGTRFDDFVGSATEGGFGTDIPTWLNTLPGWHIGLGFVPGAGPDGFANVDESSPFFTRDDLASDYWDDETGFREGVLAYTAVNPVSPTRESSLRCLRPNMLAEGDDSKLPDGISDPGVYGTYVADAIDSDVHPVLARSQVAAVRDVTHDPARTVLAGVQPAVQPTLDDFNNRSADMLSSPDDVILEFAEDTQADAEEPIPDPLDFTEDPDPEPHAEYHTSDYRDTNPTSENRAPFLDVVPEGLQCNASGELVFKAEPTEVGGGLRFDAVVQKGTDSSDNTAHDDQVKDPTLGAEGESDTDAGTWETGVYTFEGDAHAVLDTTGDQAFDKCPGANLDPGEDSCPWESIWDAYNPNCDNNVGRSCGSILEENGYNVSHGVGLHFVLKQTGSIVVTSTEPVSSTSGEDQTLRDRTQVVSAGEPTAKVCVIGTSTGFLPKLDGLVGDGDGELDDAEREQLCGDYTDDILVLEDAFWDQSATLPGAFDAAITWSKVLPTPSTVQETTQFGADDELCVTGTWTVADRTDSLDFANDTLGDPDDPGQENVRLQEGVHQFEDCDSFDTLGEPEQ